MWFLLIKVAQTLKVMQGHGERLCEWNRWSTFRFYRSSWRREEGWTRVWSLRHDHPTEESSLCAERDWIFMSSVSISNTEKPKRWRADSLERILTSRLKRLGVIFMLIVLKRFAMESSLRHLFQPRGNRHQVWSLPVQNFLFSWHGISHLFLSALWSLHRGSGFWALGSAEWPCIPFYRRGGGCSSSSDVLLLVDLGTHHVLWLTVQSGCG